MPQVLPHSTPLRIVCPCLNWMRFIVIPPQALSIHAVAPDPLLPMTWISTIRTNPTQTSLHLCRCFQLPEATRVCTIQVSWMRSYSSMRNCLYLSLISKSYSNVGSLRSWRSCSQESHELVHVDAILDACVYQLYKIYIHLNKKSFNKTTWNP